MGREEGAFPDKAIEERVDRRVVRVAIKVSPKFRHESAGSISPVAYQAWGNGRKEHEGEEVAFRRGVVQPAREEISGGRVRRQGLSFRAPTPQRRETSSPNAKTGGASQH